MRILIIDDDKMFAEPLLWRLGQEKYEYIYCKLVDDVLDRDKKLKVPKPDLILLDIMMPQGDMYSKRETDGGKFTGLKLLEDIQKQKPNIPVIIITVHQHLDLAELQKEFGDTIKEILVKPITPTEVVSRIKTLFPEAC